MSYFLFRDYIGATGKGPLVGSEKRLLKKNVVDKIDPDSLDDYFSGKILSFSAPVLGPCSHAVVNFALLPAVESFSQALSRATSLSYTAVVSDFDSVNNFAKDDSTNLNDGSNLEQARRAIEEANLSLKRAVVLFVVDA